MFVASTWFRYFILEMVQYDDVDDRKRPMMAADAGDELGTN